MYTIGSTWRRPISKHGLHPDQIVLDLIYKETPLIQRMNAVGGVAINGGGMLIHQAHTVLQDGLTVLHQLRL